MEPLSNGILLLQEIYIQDDPGRISSDQKDKNPCSFRPLGFRQLLASFTPVSSHWFRSLFVFGCYVRHVQTKQLQKPRNLSLCLNRGRSQNFQCPNKQNRISCLMLTFLRHFLVPYLSKPRTSWLLESFEALPRLVERISRHR